MGPQVLLPPGAGLVLEQVQLCGEIVHLVVRTEALGAPCPACATWSDACHSRYQRKLADLPIADRQVVVQLQVRRFRCRERSCSRRTFVEQVPGLTSKHARRTVLLRRLLEAVGLALAGRAGARLATGSAATTAADKPGQADDPILSDPNEAYRSEVTQALKDAMLAHSSSLGIGATEWLTIAAKGNDDRPRLAPADSDARTRLIRLRGSDLADFLAGKISREEGLHRLAFAVFGLSGLPLA